MSFGITIRVSTTSFIFFNPSSALVALFFPSKLKGLVTIPTVRIPISLAILATTGAAPVPVPPPIPAVINTISVSCNTDLIFISSSSADFLPISGFAPAPSPLVILSPIFTFFWARFVAKSWASVFTATNSTPWSPSWIILLSALFPHPQTPNTLIFAPGINSGIISLITIS